MTATLVTQGTLLQDGEVTGVSGTILATKGTVALNPTVTSLGGSPFQPAGTSSVLFNGQATQVHEGQFQPVGVGSIVFIAIATNNEGSFYPAGTSWVYFTLQKTFIFAEEFLSANGVGGVFFRGQVNNEQLAGATLQTVGLLDFGNPVITPGALGNPLHTRGGFLARGIVIEANSGSFHPAGVGSVVFGASVRHAPKDTIVLWHNLVAVLPQDIDIVWEGQAYVVKLPQFTWQIKEFASDDLALQWNIKEFASDDLELLWDTYIGVEQDLVLRWDVLGFIRAVLPILWRTWAYTIDNLIARWNVYETAPILDYTIKWNVLGAIFRQHQYRWDVTDEPFLPENLQVTSIGTDNTPSFRVDISNADSSESTRAIFEIYDDMAVLVGTLTSVFRTGDHTAIAEYLSSLPTGTYTVRARAEDDEGQLSDWTDPVEFTITIAVSPIDISFKWDIYKLITPKSMSLIWAVLEQDRVSLVVRWENRGLFTKDFRFKWGAETSWDDIEDGVGEFAYAGSPENQPGSDSAGRPDIWDKSGSAATSWTKI